MIEWFCTKCRIVFIGGSQSRCCGELEEFDLAKHGRDLIGLSNSWIAIEKKKYDEHPIYKEVWREYTRNGSWGAASIFIGFIDELIERLGEQETNPPHLHNFVWKRSDGYEMCECGVVREGNTLHDRTDNENIHIQKSFDSKYFTELKYITSSYSVSLVNKETGNMCFWNNELNKWCILYYNATEFLVCENFHLAMQKLVEPE